MAYADILRTSTPLMSDVANLIDGVASYAPNYAMDNQWHTVTTGIPTYNAVSGIIGTLNVSAALGSLMPIGTRIRLTQTTTKYFVVVGEPSSTTRYITGGTDYALANATITAFAFSWVPGPLAYPSSFAYSAASGITGFSTPPTLVGRFAVIGRSCTLRVNSTATGTSNANGLTMLSPLSAYGTAYYHAALIGAVDGGSAISGGMAYLSAGSNVITCHTTVAGLNWVGSGNKQPGNFIVSFEI